MRGTRILMIGPTLAACLLTSTRANSSDWQNPTGVCVDAIFHQNLKDLTTADVHRTAIASEDLEKEAILASQALSAAENERGTHEP